ARRLHTTLEGMDVKAFLDETVKKVYQNPLIHVAHEATIVDVSGYIGNFTTTVETGGRRRAINHGAAVIATGAEEYEPDEFLYKENESVVTHMELGEKIAEQDERVVGARTVVMIQCVGSRNEEHNYCSRVCCSHAVKNALKLKTINPDMNVYILFRDMRTYGFREDYYREASENDVKFIRYEPGDRPVVEAVEEGGESLLRVSVPDPVLGSRLEIDADIVSLAAAVIPDRSTSDIAGLFKLTLSPDGFFKEAHVKLKPVEFAADGVFLCGTAHYPKHVQETISQAYGAAGRVLTLLANDTVTASGSVCQVDEDACISCGACITVCTYGAIDFYETLRGRKARVNPVLCKGDGLCNAKCPTDAIFLKHFTNDELTGQIDAAVTDEEILQQMDEAVEN
ncbi:MAG TPA: 4Fe-4S dicluster domain-containing protein, partial [Desulfobacteraceae bacterium]|nr:4Fe-4S dicluster domain-containing protein [Desulfobacteraceae bacterium]